MNRWFKKFPYTGWVAIWILSLAGCIAAYFTEQYQYSEERMVTYIQNDFERRESIALKDHEAGLFESFARDGLFSGLTKDYFLFICSEREVKVWSTSSVELPQNAIDYPDSFVNGQLSTLENGYYYIRSWVLPQADSSSIYAYAVIPIYYKHLIENEYFQSYFVADKRIPVSITLSTQSGQNDYVIRNKNQHPVFYIEFNGSPRDLYKAGTVVWILAIIVCCSLCFWVHELCYNISYKQGKYYKGLLLLFVFVALVQCVLKYIDLPLGFSNSRLFSPELFSSGDEIKSLGNLIIVILLNTWVFLYVLIYAPLERYRFFKNKTLDAFFRFILVVLLLYILIGHAGNVYKLIIDSKISFEAGDFTHITIYTFVGILTLALITIDILFILAIINNLIRKIVPVFVRYLFVVIVIGVVIYLTSGFNTFYFAVLIMTMVAMLLIDTLGLPLKNNTQRYKLSITPTSYIWFAILCSWITLEIFFLNYYKEKELRKIFAQKQVPKDEALVAYLFDEFVDKINEDTELKEFMKQYLSEDQTQIEQYVFNNYFTEYDTRYNISLFLYDENRKPVGNTNGNDLLKIADSIKGTKCMYGIINLESYTGNNAYLGIFSITDQDRDTLGFIGWEAVIDSRPSIVSQRSFFQKKYNPADQQYFDKYAYAVYRNQRLYSQGGDFVFPFKNNLLTDKEFIFKESLRNSLLLYRVSGKEQVHVVYHRNLLTGFVSLFSYVLAVLLFLSGIVFLLRYLLFYPLKIRLFFRTVNPTIRSKVNLTILLTVFASFLVVGIITVSFLNDRYKEQQRKNMRNLIFYFTQNILNFCEEQNLNLENVSDTSRSGYTRLSYKLNALAEEQDAEVSIYSNKGKLIATSQLELLKKGLITPYLSPAALRALAGGEQSEVILKEDIGALKYQSIYTTIRDKKGSIIAYVHLPYYASYTEFQDEISNVLVSLINVYTLVFFLSGVCAVLISNSIVRSFRLLIDQFRNIRLARNEVIHWPYKDEISILVKEYNAMMQKVESMATKLAHTEREEAWREIAKQVAHEIKNPLTPMKLNIQYLQQAIHSGRPDIEALASKVSLTLIEQIENLNLIASEFSNFAKMPEAHPETIDLYETLHSVVALFQNEGKADIRLQPDLPKFFIYIDKSYFIRIFNNVIQNAVQSIPSERSPLIEISYEQKKNSVVIAVKDNGSGIPEDIQQSLFVPYFTTKSSGTGLGLSMTKKMVEHANGTIKFETIVGEGTVFYITFPLVNGKYI